MLKKILDVMHVLLAFCAVGFMGAAFSKAIMAPAIGMLECVVIAASSAVLASICRDVSK